MNSPNRSVAVISVLLVGAVLLVGSIGAFFLYIRFVSIMSVAVVLAGLGLAFLIGARVGGTRILRLRLIEQRVRRFRRSAAGEEATAPLDE